MKNRKIVITGASKGIGKAIAKKFALDDCEIYLISSNEKTLQYTCLLYTSPSPRDEKVSRMPSSA